MPKFINHRVLYIKLFGATLQPDGSYIDDTGYIGWYNEAGAKHNAKGPSIKYSDGSVAWYINGINYSFADWCIAANKTDEVKMLLRLQYDF
jgi:hypothetical protein